MEINIIAAVAANRAIGYQNDMVYFISEDLKRFKQLTTGHTIIMGRKTFHSLPKGALPNRRNIVLSRTETDFPNCDVYSSLEEALNHIGAEEQAFIIGGASLYKEALAIADLTCSSLSITMANGLLNHVSHVLQLTKTPHTLL